MATGDSPQREAYRVIDRYAIFDEIASGGMATVHIGRLVGPGGFSRTIAVKRLHEHLAKDPSFVDMFLDEARLAARITHPNVVQTVDIVHLEGQLFLVMDYVQGESLSRLLRSVRARGEKVPLPIVGAIMVGILQGLHAAHEATNESGEPLEIVHRDVSPQNAMIGLDGVPRVLDFGIAKAIGRMHTTRDGSLKGKLAYMAPEQIRKGNVTRQADIYAASVILWEMLANERLFGSESTGDNEAVVLERVLFHDVPEPSTRTPEVPSVLDAIALRGLSRDATARFATARDMARAIEEATKIASSSTVGEWVAEAAAEALRRRALKVAEIEAVSDVRQLPPSSEPVSGRRPIFNSQMDTASGNLRRELGAIDIPVTVSTGRTRTLVIIALAVLALVAIVRVTVRAIRSEHASPVAAAAAPVAPSAAALPPPAPTTADKSEPTSAGPTVVASASPAPSAPTTRSPNALAKPHSTAAPTKPAAAPARPSCSPPYVIDAAGMKQYKLECL